MNIFNSSSADISREINLEEGEVRSSVSRGRSTFWAHLNDHIQENIFLELGLLTFTLATGIQDASVVSFGTLNRRLLLIR